MCNTSFCLTVKKVIAEACLMAYFSFLFSLGFTKPETGWTWKILWRVGCNSVKRWMGAYWKLYLHGRYLFDHFIGQSVILLFLFYLFLFTFLFWIRFCSISISKLRLMKLILAFSSCLGWLWKSVCFGEMMPG